MKVGLKCEDKFSDKRQKRGHRPREEGHEKIEVSTKSYVGICQGKL